MNEHIVESDSGARRELLVVLRGEQAEESLKQLSAKHNVQHVISPRVIVIEGAQNELAGLRAVPGVLAATAGELPPAVLEGLDESEALFVAAWSSRTKEGTSKQRPGEGLAWDAPGFVPPDPPAGDTEPG
jgi:hypothetical protein